MSERESTGLPDATQAPPFFRAVLDAMPAAVMIVDDDVRVVEYNAAAAALLGGEGGSILRRRGGDAMHCLHSLEAAEGCGHAPYCRNCVIRRSVGAAIEGQAHQRLRTKLELVAGDETIEVYALISASPFPYDGRQLVVLVIEDISELAELQRIVPICVHCGRVRDDDQYWRRVEEYFGRHWDLDFTHGYCPTCFENEMRRLDALPDGGPPPRTAPSIRSVASAQASRPQRSPEEPQ